MFSDTLRLIGTDVSDDVKVFIVSPIAGQIDVEQAGLATVKVIET